MSIEENKAVVRRIYEAMNKQDLAALDELCAPDYVIHGMPPDFSPDLAGMKQGCFALWTAFPDMQVVLEDLIAEGDKVAHRFTMRATHQRDFMGIPPTGKVVAVMGIYISRFAGGTCVEDWRQVDDLGWLQQLGAIPQMAQAGA